MSDLYDTDLHAWATEQAALLRQRHLDVADIDNIAEEIEDVGRSQRAQLESRLTILLVHLLKWRHQPANQGNSWRLTIRGQRVRIRRHIAKNPSLRPQVLGLIDEVWETVVIDTAQQTGLVETVFPPVCPWRPEQILDDDFWP